MKRKTAIALCVLIVAELALWAVVGRARLDESVFEHLVARYAEGLGGREDTQKADFLFVCPELTVAAGAKAVARAERRLKSVGVELLLLEDLEAREPSPNGNYYASLCATVRSNTPILAVVQIADGYGTHPGYGYRSQQAYLHFFGGWWPAWEWGLHRTVF